MADSRPFCCFGAAALSIGAVAAVALGGSVPVARVGLANMAQRIAHEDCRLLIVGDSNSLKGNNHRMIGGICRTWHPDQFVGRVSPGAASVDEGVQILTSSNGLNVQGRAIEHVGSGDLDMWSNGQDGFIPNRAWDMVATGTGLSSNALYCTAQLTRLDEYAGGDWSSGGNMRTRLIFAHDQTGYSQLRYRARRGPLSGAFTTFSPHHDAQRPMIDWIDADVPQTNGSIFTEVRTPESWTSDGQGGAGPCPDNCTPGRTLFHVGQLIWRTDVPGLQIDSVAEGGFTVADHLAPWQYDDDALQGYLAATRNPNCFMVLLGQNMNEAESQDIGGLWKSEVVALIERYRAASLEVDPTGDPLFILVSPWSTNDTSTRFPQINTALTDIAMARSDTGFINMHLLSGAHRYLNGAVLFDGYHAGNDAAADLFAELLWNQIDRELQELPDVVISGEGQDLSSLVLDTGTVVHIASGIHQGPLALASSTVEVNGWNDLDCGIEGTTAGPAVHVSNGASVTMRRLNLRAGAGVLEDGGHLAGATLYSHNATIDLHTMVISGGSVHRGGAIALRQTVLSATNCEIVDGTASDSGGLIDAADSIIELNNVSLESGHAARGGGLFTVAGVLLGNDVSIRHSTASGNGGGGAMSGTASFLLDCHIRTNAAGNSGGGLWLDQADMTLVDSVVCGNDSDDLAGDWIDGGGNIVGGTCTCPSDLNDDGATDITDLLQLLSAWGPDESGGDINNDGMTDVEDLLLLISGYGPCT